MAAGSAGGRVGPWALAKPVRFRLLFACLVAALSTILAVVPLLLVGWAVSSVGIDSAPLRFAALAAGFAVLLQPILAGVATACAHYAAFDLLFVLRRDLMHRLAALPLSYFTQRQDARVQRVLGDEVEAVELFISHHLPDVVAALATILVLSGMMAWADWRLALAALAVLPIGAAAQAAMMRGHGEKMGLYFGRIGRVNATAAELVLGLETLKTLQGGRLMMDGALQQVRDLHAFAEEWRAQWMPGWVLYTVIIGAAPAFVLPVGLWLQQHGSVTPAALVFCLLAATGLGVPLLKLVLYAELLMRTRQAAGKIAEIVDAAPERPVSDPAPLAPGPVVFDGVSLEMGGRAILQDISLAVLEGGITAIVGPSGAGKTSLARLFNQSLEPTRGRITVGGRDVSEVAPGALGRLVGVVSQDVFLFNDTILENIRTARPAASVAEVDAAARAAHCHDFIAALPKGYETRVGEGGSRLSGGQRQRVALARALLADLPILLLDEATSFADPVHEALLQDAVGRLADRKTIVVISHRLDSVVGCDRIVLMENGRIVAAGTHDALLGAAPRYAELWRIQQRNLSWGLGAAKDDTPSRVEDAAELTS
ncbi:ABC transporter ATP-binding protein [Enterovirga rhinocerotis]|uniref:Phosphate-transporting ATPase/ATP-binding cassette subfamily B protein n=1 Tax=Enterovirga rhinocerotis TaxID=1339210 RepID=A0A4R7CC41_9HYPH|nr:ABC transporter ATP-binding protein [Enterovirga rhinocerotis]TDR95025.1 phosphate-transporting ATPase/ATP-binding cassette subfamily B protein [Enterovirga rhinocerotis]